MGALKVNGVEVDLPSIDTLNMDEAILFEENAGVSLEEIDGGASIPMRGLKILLHIAIQRALPDAPFADVSEAAGGVKLADLVESVPTPEAESPPTTGEQSSPVPPGGLPSDESSETSDAGSAPPTSGTHESASSESDSIRLVV